MAAVEFTQVVSRGCGMDIHKEVATVRGEGIQKEPRSFGTFTSSLTELREWLVSLGITHVAMESTGGAVQPYRYTGKELTRFNALNWYNYGARWYDPATLRWNGVDELAEKYTPVSPYVYCLDNPVNNIDSDGKKVRPIKYTGTNITYYHSPKEFQNAMIAFGKTTFGHQILSDFTPKGKSIFGVIGNGKYANYELNLHEFDFSNPQEQTSRLFVYGEGMVYAQTQLNFKDGKPQFDIIFDVQRSESELVETITHEIALHLSNYSEILETFQSTGNVTATRNVWNKETSAEQHNDVIKAGGGILRGTYNYKRTSSELIKRFPNLKSIFDIMHKEYEKRYK